VLSFSFLFCFFFLNNKNHLCFDKLKTPRKKINLQIVAVGPNRWHNQFTNVKAVSSVHNYKCKVVFNTVLLLFCSNQKTSQNSVVIWKHYFWANLKVFLKTSLCETTSVCCGYCCCCFKKHCWAWPFGNLLHLLWNLPFWLTACVHSD